MLWKNYQLLSNNMVCCKPIIVRKVGSVYYELIAGERRLRACELAGYHTISAVILNINDSQSALISMTENLQRKDLHF